MERKYRVGQIKKVASLGPHKFYQLNKDTSKVISSAELHATLDEYFDKGIHLGILNTDLAPPKNISQKSGVVGRILTSNSSREFAYYKIVLSSD